MTDSCLITDRCSPWFFTVMSISVDHCRHHVRWSRTRSREVIGHGSKVQMATP